MSIFKSYKPRRYMSVDRYNKIQSDNTDLSKRVAPDVNGKLHQFREICSNCNQAYGNHASDTDVCPTKNN